MKLKEEEPGFDKSRYEFECLVPGCDGRVLFHYANLHQGPRSQGYACHILSKCLNPECGKVYSFEPPVTEEEREHLLSLWGRDKYFPWSKEHGHGPEEMKKIYTEEEQEKILKRLKNLGYF